MDVFVSRQSKVVRIHWSNLLSLNVPCPINKKTASERFAMQLPVW